MRFGGALAACLVLVSCGLRLALYRDSSSSSETVSLAAALLLPLKTRTVTPKCDAVRAEVEFPPAEALMKLYVTVSVTLCETGKEVAIEYRPDRSSLASLWVTGVVKTASQPTEFRLFRLRANQPYSYTVWVQDSGVAARGTFVAPATGWERFDDGPYVAASGDAVPSFEVGTFAVYPSITATNQSLQWFDGIIGVDAEGWVVWMYSLCMIEGWDFLPDHTIAMLARTDGSCDALAGNTTTKGVPSFDSKGDDGRLYVANSQLQVVSPDGTLVSQYIARCAGGPLNFNKLSHECRVDHNSAHLRILATMYEAEFVPDMRVPLKMGPTETVMERADTFANTVIVAWDHGTNELTPLYALSDIVPVTQKHLFETTAWNPVHMACSGDYARPAIEFHHVSSVSVGCDENYIVASRNLDTIWSLKRDGSGVQWTLSSHPDEIGSNFTFERDLDKFYQPHSALQLENGMLLLVDDGTDRPGCTIARTGACFSRAIVYELDRERGAVRVVWQFTYPEPLSNRTSMIETAQIDTWNEVGGSAYRLSNGHYLVAFSSVAASKTNPRGAAQVFELDVDGTHTATSFLQVPTPIGSEGMQNGYRFVPWHSISGESSTPPDMVLQ
ncbi:hypothetical protein CTAYLR_002380 [Chrysophaeum taylorii]|uniref:Uncharacterized protein n=1 Tax=Chrysophaeum taylorii TaxID=2483200 RepID=A0AAD7UH40_9STRA|nr:hypothetical protein CTAYLR_002380 [Chrysophaeum taylorii]